MAPITHSELPSHVQTFMLTDDGRFPNSVYPLLVYPPNEIVGETPSAEDFERVFTQNGWPASWRNGVYSYHHYHATAHELLGCYAGQARVLFGGPEGIEIEFPHGYAVVIPAGVAHSCVSQSADFRVVAAYPPGQSADMNYGNDGERPGTDEAIKRVAPPFADPITGPDGPITTIWV